MALPATRFTQQPIVPKPSTDPAPYSKNSSRDQRVEAFEQLRQRTVHSQEEYVSETRSTQHLQLARAQADLEEKWRQRGVLPSASAYGSNGQSDGGSPLGRFIDLYA
ncbi:MAG: hypothetical protein OEM52_08000 [bacterium]|nr:hypothetical protein [bacterium]